VLANAAVIDAAGNPNVTVTNNVQAIDTIAPTANNDTGTATESGVVLGSNATGNVLTNDLDASAKTVSALSFGVTNGIVGSALSGSYGNLTLNTDGSYTYVVTNSNATVNALNASSSLTETFTYTVSDVAGNSSNANLTVTINGTNDAAVPSDYHWHSHHHRCR
jgi:VCBS repeat-containing protein